MLYTSAKYGLSKRYTNHCVLHHCKFLVLNKSWKDIPYVCVSGHKSEASIKSYARKLSSSTKHVISNTFSRATEVLVANNASIPKKTTKNNHAAHPKVFSLKHVSSREQQFQVIPVLPLSMIPGKLF